MQLEQTLGMYQPMQMQRTPERERVYTIVNLESLSAIALYSKEKNSDYIEGIEKGSKDGPALKFYSYLNLKRFGEIELGIQIPGESHDAYKIDSDGNVSGGHSTINLPRDGKVYMPHELGKPSIRSGSG